jgi:hypothetical protein
MIDLSRTCGTDTILICYASVMFTICSWIKIKSKVLIYLWFLQLISFLTATRVFFLLELRQKMMHQ